MKGIWLLSIILFSQFANCQDVLFSKSPRKYKVKEYLFIGAKTIYDVPVKIRFDIFLKLKNHVSRVEKNYSVSFGGSPYEQINISNDTISYFPKGDVSETLFVLNSSAKGDTLCIDEFCSIYNHDCFLESSCYYSKVKDSVYVFKLFEHKSDLTNQHIVVSSTADDGLYDFHEIAICKTYGFLWVKYTYFGVEYEVRFR